MSIPILTLLVLVPLAGAIALWHRHANSRGAAIACEGRGL